MELPKYFIVKRDASNPLWQKYINWLNETYESNWAGDTPDTYYGYDGFSGTDVWQTISKFENNPTILTLEQWDEIVNGFKLPKIWAIKQSISEEACEWFSKFKATRSAKIEGSYEYMVYFSNQNRTEFFNKLPENCVEITIEQFKKYVLKQDKPMNKPIIAYKTIKRMPGLPIGTMFTNDGGGWVSEDGEWGFNNDVINDTEFFEPVYETIPVIDIRGYVAKFDFKERTVSFGCQTYTEQFVNNLVDFNKNSGLRIDEFDKIKQVFEVFKNN